MLEEPSSQLWWAGKELARGKKLMDYVGRNEKTKMTAKLQKKGQGAPAREPVFSEEERKKMMAYAYRKQEEHKVTQPIALLAWHHTSSQHVWCFSQKLEASEEDVYLNAEWADPSALKKQFSGLTDISWKPK